MKKMLSMLLALILVFSLVGCSGSSGDSGTADTGGDSSAAEESDVIKIGLYTPLWWAPRSRWAWTWRSSS